MGGPRDHGFVRSFSGASQGLHRGLAGRVTVSRVVSLEIPGIVVSLEISREILFVLRQKYTWTSPRFFLDFPGLFPGFFWG